MVNIISRSSIVERFLPKIMFIIFTLLITGCDTDTIINEPTDKFATITINDKLYKIKSEYMGCNESCNHLYTMIQYPKGDDSFTIEFRFAKSGAIKNFSLMSYNENGISYETADFNPKGLMTVNNFEYDESKSYLHFNFDGYLVQFSNSSDLDINKKRKYIKGEVTVNNVTKTECTSFISDLNFETNDLNFSTSFPFTSYDSGLKTNPYRFEFYSDNGYRTIFKSKTDLWNQEKGTYTFDQNSIENRIDFEQYIGIFRATQILWSRDIDWKKYQTSGSYTIKEHIIINGLKVTKGEMNLLVYDNGILLHTINNGTFEVIGFN
jgi:hypothetical protein